MISISTHPIPFHIGIFIGIFLVLLIIVIYELISNYFFTKKIEQRQKLREIEEELKKIIKQKHE